MNRNKSTVVLSLVFALIFSAASCAQNTTKTMQVTPEEEAFLLKERRILQEVKNNFPDTLPSDQEFFDATLSLLPQLLDRHSIYLTAEETTMMEEDQKGFFGGIGIVIKLASPKTEGEGKAVLEVQQDPDKGTPGANVGIKKHDRIIAINDIPVEQNLLKATLRIRGPEGTTVKLTVVRDGSPTPLVFTLTREKMVIKEAHLAYALKGDVAVITLPQFTKTVDKEFDTNVAPDMLAKKVKFAVLDLRNNPGGDTEVCRHIASYWTDTQQLVTKFQFKSRTQEKWSVPTTFTFTGIKTAVLVNSNSASCSEIVAGALQDWHAATIIGTLTFGKGLVQTVIPFGDGSTLIVTSAVWLTPSGRQINKGGIEPDILMPLTIEDEKAKRDPQMDRALEFLKTGK